MFDDMLFISTFSNKIDKKARISVPAQYRAILENEVADKQGLILYSSFLHPCIEACSLQRLYRLYEYIDRLEPFSAERDAFETTILAGSIQVQFDQEGRIVLPSNLVQAANLTNQAVFVGKGKTFEIWQPEAYQAYAQQARALALTQRNKLQPTKHD